MNEEVCPRCKYPVDEYMICEDGLYECYCSNCGLAFDDILEDIFYPKKEKKNEKRPN